jgi:hypothetical protein
MLRAFLLSPVLVFVFCWPALAPTDPDYWWHVRTGQLIAQTGSIPRVDVFSFTAAGQPWIAHEWLTELGFALVQSRFGYVGNVLGMGLLGGLAALALFATCRRWGVGELPAVVLVLWAFGMSLGSFGVRPQGMTRVLLTLSVLVLTIYRQHRDRRLLLVFPPLLALWSNLHGGFVIGLGLLGLSVLGEAVESVHTRSPKYVWPIALATALSAAATLLNPNGVSGLLYPLAYAQQGFGGQQLIAEWQPPDLRQPGFAPFGLSLLVAFALGWAGRPLGATEVLWALSFGLLGMQSVRNIQLYATVATPLIGARLRMEVPAFGRSIAQWQRPRRMAVLWSIVVVASAGVWALQFTRASDWAVQLGKEPSAAAFPVGGTAYIQDHGLRGNLFNQYEWGGYLIYAAYPDQHVFIDGRPDMYGQRLLDEYVTVERLRPNWRQILDTYDVRLMLIDKDGPLASELARDPQWRQLYVGPVERVFERGQ